MTLKTTSEDLHPELGRSQSRHSEGRQETSTGWGSTLHGCLSDSPEKKRQLSFSISSFLRPDRRKWLIWSQEGLRLYLKSFLSRRDILRR